MMQTFCITTNMYPFSIMISFHEQYNFLLECNENSICDFSVWLLIFPYDSHVAKANFLNTF